VFDIVTIDKTKELDFISYTTDFENALWESLRELFPNKRGVGCYFHYTNNLLKKSKSLSLYSKDLKLTTKECLKELYKLPFIINEKNNKYIDKLFSVYITKNKKMKNLKIILFFKYYISD